MSNSFAWGKFDNETSRFHRLEHHCADVAACFLELLADPVLEKRVAIACGMERLDPVTRMRLAYVAYLHDFGKVNCGFQFKVDRLPKMQGQKPKKAGHIAEALMLSCHPEMCEALNLSGLANWGQGIEPLLFATLAHHGRPAYTSNQTGTGPKELWKPIGDYDPVAAARVLEKRGRQWLSEAFENEAPPLPDNPALAHLFCGLITLADQIGSDMSHFPLEPKSDPDYWTVAQNRAGVAVRKKLFARRFWRTGNSSDSVSVQKLFGYDAPRPSQQAIQEVPLDDRLLILESETGSGKTEAALLRFASLWKAGIVDGLYFALPTRAAAKQLHRRVSDALKNLLPKEAKIETVLAVPGYLKADGHSGKRDLNNKFKIHWDDDPGEEVRLARWATEQARTYLSAPAAVGTIDQILLAGLQIKWAHLRASSVARSLLVIDEVHASSSYMSALLRNVLHDHLEIGGHAFIMSATLGATARDQFLHKSLRENGLDFDAATVYPYPVLSLSKDATKSPKYWPIDSPAASKIISITTSENLENPSTIAEIAIAAAQTGARVLIIRNTVNSVQSVFDALLYSGHQDLLLNVNSQPTLHHSRFSVEDRELLDHIVERELGKQSFRDRGKIIIGTQTLEQSLDIDADFLISDLCPVDVLLQRIGRLHRHHRDDRPPLYNDPRCLVLVPESGLEGGLDRKLLKYGMGTSKSGGVYEDIVALESTRRVIEELSPWIVPSMCRELVEKVTHREELHSLAKQLGGAWKDHFNKITGKGFAEGGVAQLHALKRTEPFDGNFNFVNWTDQFQLRTRLGENEVRVKLASPTLGPFGKCVATFNLPAHIFDRSRLAELDVNTLESATLESVSGNNFLLTVGDFRFAYSPRGVSGRDPTDSPR
ncbi:MAG: CRISPR-associated helicase Cas3' [Rhodothermaceae bacterium]|nr:CRISPR-associated helicase Cas3' [Rhodothermaceae bacterium]MYE62970.1 CRISPR-associated helicase Cas3' [Rhodothermaceae bacterium]MYJ20475.1 CRISPR-associated helicase Cas3' [Rhodothermaceae bacterium]